MVREFLTLPLLIDAPATPLVGSCWQHASWRRTLLVYTRLIDSLASKVRDNQVRPPTFQTQHTICKVLLHPCMSSHHPHHVHT
jgi:hypothetical protein